MAKHKRRGHGEGTIFPRKDGRWQASFIPENGKRRYVYGKTQAEALEKLRKLQNEDKQGTLATGPRQKLGEYLTQWLEATHKPPMARHSTYMQYRWAINKHLVPSLGNILLTKLTVQHVQAFYAQKLKEGLTPRSVTIIHAVLHCALENAVKWNMISRNVASLVTVPRRVPYNVHPLSAVDAKRLLHSAKESGIEAILVMAVTTGMRRGELLGLRWDDIDLARKVLHVRRTISRIGGYGFIENDPKTKSSRRRVVLPNVVVEALKVHHIKQEQLKQVQGNKWKENNLVFPNTRGNFLRPETLLHTFHKVLDQAGLAPMRFHDLRHSAATLLLTMGVHPKVVQELLGHSTIAMTMDTYSHLLPSMQQEAMGKMDDMFGSSET